MAKNVDRKVTLVAFVHFHNAWMIINASTVSTIIVPVTAIPYADASAEDDLKTEHQHENRRHQQPIDGGNINLSHFIARGV